MSDLLNGVAAGAIGDVASLVTGGIAGGMSARKAEKLAKAQYARQLDFWNKQNEYNLPINQKKRLQDAGLSVGLMYSQGGNITNAGELSSVPGDPSAGRVNVHSGFMDNMLAAQRMTAEIDEIQSRAEYNRTMAEVEANKSPVNIELMESQRRLNQIYGDNAKLEGTALELDNAYKKAMNPISIEQAKQSYEQGKELLRRYISEADESVLNVRFAKDTYDTRKDMVEMDLVERATQVALMGVQAESLRQGVELSKQELSNLKQDFKMKLIEVATGQQNYRVVKSEADFSTGSVAGRIFSNVFGTVGQLLGGFRRR